MQHIGQKVRIKDAKEMARKKEQYDQFIDYVV
jgi:hypothetical protein